MGSTEEYRKTLNTGAQVKREPVGDEVEATLRRDVEKAQGNLRRYLARRTTHPPCESQRHARQGFQSTP